VSYTTEDFDQSLQRVTLEPRDIEAVVAAWGTGSGMGEDAGHFKWSEDGASDWSGGFLMRRRDGRYVYLTGWCDYTGWGCQDGATLHEFDARPTYADLKALDEYDHAPPESEWDIEPADLNRWLSTSVAEHPEPSTR